MGGYAIDRATGKGWLTAAGLLMFGKGLSVRERFDNIRMDYIDESNLLPGSRWSDRLTYDGMWENNLYNFVRQITPKLVNGIKRPFRLEGMVRVDDTPVHKAIREAVANMIIHNLWKAFHNLCYAKLIVMQSQFRIPFKTQESGTFYFA